MKPLAYFAVALAGCASTAWSWDWQTHKIQRQIEDLDAKVSQQANRSSGADVELLLLKRANQDRRVKAYLKEIRVSTENHPDTPPPKPKVIMDNPLEFETNLLLLDMWVAFTHMWESNKIRREEEAKLGR